MRASALRYQARVHIVSVQLSKAFTANATTDYALFTVPDHGERTGFPRFRVAKVAVATKTVPADNDGAINGFLDVYDKSEAAFDRITSAENLENLVTNNAKNLTFAAESGNEVQRTLNEGDVVYFRVDDSSAAIDTNIAAGDMVVTMELLPLDVPGESFGQAI